MNMIDVLKRLAELDDKNPNIVKENANLEECGPMGMMGGMSQPQTPASVNITAGSGQELSAMLKDIMSLAGIHKVEPDHLGVEPEPMTLTAEPVAAVGPMHTASDDMRSVIDKLNPDMDGEQDGEQDGEEEETDEGMWDNSGNKPTNVPPMNHDAMLNKDMQNQDQAGHQGVGDRNDGKQPKAFPGKALGPKAFPTMEAQLMAEYKRFISETNE
jgi:hypothetical protein